MATYKVRDRSGGTLEVSSKEQADSFVAAGYVIVTGDKPKAERTPRTTRTAAKKSTARTADKK